LDPQTALMLGEHNSDRIPDHPAPSALELRL
jgi:hypothetical protein